MFLGILGGTPEHWAQYGRAYRRAWANAGHEDVPADIAVAVHGFIGGYRRLPSVGRSDSPDRDVSIAGGELRGALCLRIWQVRRQLGGKNCRGPDPEVTAIASVWPSGEITDDTPRIPWKAPFAGAAISKRTARVSATLRRE
jgi:hypothetical protein